MEQEWLNKWKAANIRRTNRMRRLETWERGEDNNGRKHQQTSQKHLDGQAYIETGLLSEKRHSWRSNTGAAYNHSGRKTEKTGSKTRQDTKRNHISK